MFTHAFFKALLFLAAGSVMHAMGGIIDMRRFSGLRKVVPTTHWTFLCGALALSGVPPLAGFWSKDDILSGTAAAAHGAAFPGIYQLLLIAGLLTAGLTAFYTFRAYFLTFQGEERVPHEAGHHAHESPPVMTIPLMILAIGAVCVGWIGTPWTPGLQHFLARADTLHIPEEHEVHWGMMAISSLVAVAGVGLAYFVYVVRPGLASQLAHRFLGAYELSLNKFHVDELYDTFVVRPLAGLAEFCRIIDLYVIDGLVDLFAQVPRLFGVLMRPIQNGLVQFYALAMSLSVGVFLWAMLWRLAR